MSAGRHVFVHCAADARQRWARHWVIERRAAAPTRPLALVTDHLAAAGDLLHPILLEPDQSGHTHRGLFLVHRFTLDLLALELCRLELSRRQSVQVTPTARRALVGRVLHDAAERLRYFAPVAGTPGFVRVLARTLDELRLHGISGAQLDELGGEHAAELALLLQRYEQALEQEALIDRAALFALAAEIVTQGSDEAKGSWAGMIFADVELCHPRELDLLRALGAGGLDLAATVPAGDPQTQGALESAWLGLEFVSGPAARAAVVPGSTGQPPALARLQRDLFDVSAQSDESTPSLSADHVEQEDGSVDLFSAPMAPLECVEIARRALTCVREGVPAERIAVLVRQAFPYVELLEEAFRRAGLEIYPAEGAYRPDPAGRAFLLLLRCKLEGLPATRFAEYLSLGQVPPTDSAEAEADRAPARGEHSDELDDDDLFDEPSDPPQQDYVAPARWERLIGDAAVIGGLERWRRRLDGLERELQARREGLEDADSAHGRAIERDLRDLQALSKFALPLLARVDALPDRARWGEWVEALQPLARSALRRPARVVELLQELWPLAEAGPVSLQRVLEALQRQLTELRRRPPASRRYGRVYVGLADEVRGRSFDVIFVAGLAERSFPQKVLQDPVLLDGTREELMGRTGSQPPLQTAQARRQKERLALHLAVGAARQRVVLSYPRMELSQGQPRVPSFYLLEAIRASRGALPDYERLIAEAAKKGVARLEKPYPPQPEGAIDAPEYDLSLLAEAERKRRAQPHEDLAGYSGQLHEHPRLVHALRAHWQRGWRKLSPHDGLVAEGQATLASLEAERPRARPFSPTALERYGRCPYQFFLYGLLRLRPLQDLEPEGHYQVDPLTRGRLYHEVQFGVFRQLRADAQLPLRPEGLERAFAVLSQVFEAVERSFREELSPAVPVLWQQEMSRLRGELSSWLRREAEQGTHTPLHFELGFGLKVARAGDEASSAEPAQVGDYLLRGAIDLVEAAPEGGLRVTDYKTGRSPAGRVDGLRGGTSLQRVLYGLAYEALHAESVVREGRLYYCSERGGYRELSIPLDEAVRAQTMLVLDTIDEAIHSGTLPAVPEKDCLGCDYVRVCGRDAAQRARRKLGDGRLEPLKRVRRL